MRVRLQWCLARTMHALLMRVQESLRWRLPEAVCIRTVQASLLQ
jgi:hypothetical protein